MPQSQAKSPESALLIPARPALDSALEVAGVELAEEESGLRERRTVEQRAHDAYGIAVQLEREARALVHGLEAIRFALHTQTGAEARRIKARAQALAHVRDGLVQVLAVAAATPRLFVEGSAFVEYLRGLAAWAHATLEALDDCARGRDTAANLLARVELAKNLHFDDLAGEVERELRHEGVYDPAVGRVGEATARLIFVANVLESRL